MNRRSGTLYTPQKTRDYEKLIGQLVAEAATEAINETDDLWIECSFELAGNKRKDLDNLVKAVWDGITLSKAVWGDDKQVVSSRETVEYGADLPWVSIAVGVVREGRPRKVRPQPEPRRAPGLFRDRSRAAGDPPRADRRDRQRLSGFCQQR